MNNVRLLKLYNLFLDDLRTPLDCAKYLNDERYVTSEWVIVRSHDEFVQIIKKKWEDGEFVRLVSFDHDLMDEHYDPSMFIGLNAYENAYKQFQYPTGRRSVEFLLQFCKEKDIPFPEYIIHTMNPAGRERIKLTIDKYVDSANRINNNDDD